MWFNYLASVMAGGFQVPSMIEGGWWPPYPVAYICLKLANVGLLT